MNESLLKISDLTKSYGNGNFTLGPISLSISKGEAAALLGKNGAGKTTLFQITTGNTRADEGAVEISGRKMTPENFQLKRKIGYLPQHLELPKWVSGIEILKYAIKLYKLEDPDNLLQKSLKYWDCQDFAEKPLASCSHGMQKRLGLALATIHDPPLLILDEPFSGLDLFHIKALEDLIFQRKEKMHSSIICTHIAPYAAKLCDSAFIIENGKIESLESWKEGDYVSKIKKMEARFFS